MFLGQNISLYRRSNIVMTPHPPLTPHLDQPTVTYVKRFERMASDSLISLRRPPERERKHAGRRRPPALSNTSTVARPGMTLLWRRTTERTAFRFASLAAMTRRGQTRAHDAQKRLSLTVQTFQAPPAGAVVLRQDSCPPLAVTRVPCLRPSPPKLRSGNREKQAVLQFCCCQQQE